MEPKPLSEAAVLWLLGVAEVSLPGRAEHDSRGPKIRPATFDVSLNRTAEGQSKELLLGFGRLPGVVLDNVKGVTFGPRVPDGARTPTLVSDNNFSASGQLTQYLAFKAVE